jgi:hypothetical protein
MIRTIAALLALASVACADPPAAWRFTRGDTLLYRLENTFRISPAARPDGVDQGGADVDHTGTASGKYEQSLWMQVEVGIVTGDGDAPLTLTFPRVTARVRMDDTGEEASWDSQSGKPPAEHGFGPYAALQKTTFKAVVRANGDVASLEGSRDYLIAKRTRVRRTTGEMTRPEKAADLAPMPMPVEFWLSQVFSTVPPDGASPAFERRITELWEISRVYSGEFDSVRDIDGVRCLLHRLECPDERIEQKREGKSPEDLVTPEPRAGDNVKTVLASCKREIRSWFATEAGLMLKVEGEARDDRFRTGSIVRSQAWQATLEKRIPAK